MKRLWILGVCLVVGIVFAHQATASFWMEAPWVYRIKEIDGNFEFIRLSWGGALIQHGTCDAYWITYGYGCEETNEWTKYGASSYDDDFLFLSVAPELSPSNPVFPTVEQSGLAVNVWQGDASFYMRPENGTYTDDFSITFSFMCCLTPECNWGSGGQYTVNFDVDSRPVADAGPDQVITGTAVTLDASNSYDPDGDELTYEWIWPCGWAVGVNPTISIPFSTTIPLTVSDGRLVDRDSVNITVTDSPMITGLPPLRSSWFGCGEMSMGLVYKLLDDATFQLVRGPCCYPGDIDVEYGSSDTYFVIARSSPEYGFWVSPNFDEDEIFLAVVPYPKEGTDLVIPAVETRYFVVDRDTRGAVMIFRPEEGHTYTDDFSFGYGTGYRGQHGVVRPSGCVMLHQSVHVIGGPPEISAAEIDIDPDVLNLESAGNFVTCYIELAQGYYVEDISMGSVALTRIDDDLLDPLLYTVGPSEIGDYDSDSIPDRMVKFDRQELITLLHDLIDPPLDVELVVNGELDDGIAFEGSDTIRVTSPGGGPQNTGLQPGTRHVFALHQNSPNPFRDATTISFSLAEKAYVTLAICDASGRTAATLVDDELVAGTHTVNWKADVPSGVYFSRLRAGDFTDTKKMILLQ